MTGLADSARHSFKPAYIYIICMFVGMCLIVSCTSDRPDDVLSPRRLENLLYDYHTAEALGAIQQDNPDYYTRLYTAAALRKHGVTEKEFNASMQYYMRHTEQLNEIYKRLAERYSTEAGDASGRITASLGGDTTDIWNAASAYLLSVNGNNFLQEKLQADTALCHGDQLLWTFNTQWIYHEGAKTAAAVIAVRYANDSTAITTQTIRTTGRQELSIYIGKEKPVSITCLLYLEAPWSRTPKLLLITQPQLIRIRAKRKTPEELRRDSVIAAEAAKRDSTQTIQPIKQRERQLRDSLLRSDSVRGHHFQ